MFKTVLKNQTGAIAPLMIVFLLVGLAVGIFLVQQRTNILPKAQTPELAPQTAFHLLSTGKNISEVASDNGESSPSGVPFKPLYTPGEEVWVDLAVSTDVDYANVFNANIQFPKDLLEVKEILVHRKDKQVQKYPKIENILVQLMDSENKEDFARKNGLTVVDGKVMIIITLDSSIIHAKPPTFENYGFEEESRYFGQVAGFMPIKRLLELTKSIDVAYISADGLNYALDSEGSGALGTIQISEREIKEEQVAIEKKALENEKSDVVCAQVITRACKARNRTNSSCRVLEMYPPRLVCDKDKDKRCRDFPTPCDVPDGWYIDNPNEPVSSTPPMPATCELIDCAPGFTCKPGVCRESYPPVCQPAQCIADVPEPTCRPRPACLDSDPVCALPETSDMCPPSPDRVKNYFIKFWIEQKHDNENGVISLIGGVPQKGIKTMPLKQPIMATIVFKTKAVGNAEIKFGDDSTIIRVSDNANILSIKNGISIQIAERPKSPGDIDGDGSVGYKDFSILLSKWGTDNKDADLNGDGKVNLPDFSILLSNWGKRR